MNFSTGWVPKPEEVWKTVKFLEEQTDNGPALFAQAAPNLMAELDDEDPVFFWDFEEKVLGKRLNSWNQLQVGSCVSFGCGRAVQDLMLIQIAAGAQEMFPAEVATEPIYGGSRVEVGGGQISGDGSVGAWAARWVKDWGVLLRQKYGSYDLLKYDEARCRDYGRRGCPDPLEPEAKKHPVKSTAMVRTGDELWAALGAYKPVSVASDQGFTTTLREGYCEPSGTWMHQMCVIPGCYVDAAVPKKVEDIKVGDTLTTHKGRLRKVQKVYERDYAGSVVTLKTVGCLPITVTPNHPVLVYRKKTAELIAVAHELDIELNQLTGDDSVSTGRYSETATYGLRWVNAGDVTAEDFVLANPKSEKYSYQIPDWKVTDSNKRHCKFIPDKMEPSSELSWLFGMFLADGHALAGHKVQITLNKHETEEAAKCIAGFKRIGLEATTIYQKNCIRVTAYNAVVANSFASWFGNGSEKKIPEWLMSGEWDHEALIDGLAAGDGGVIKSNGTIYFVNTSRVLIEQMRSILVDLGFRPKLTELNYPSSVGPNWKTRYRIDWITNEKKIGGYVKRTKLGLAHRVSSVEVKEYTGKVYNFEVEEDHTYLVSGVAVHNCYRGRFVHPRKGRSIIDQNSWGSYLSGDRFIEVVTKNGIIKKELPEGCFAITLATAHRMVSQEDSFAYAGLDGWKKTFVDHTP